MCKAIFHYYERSVGLTQTRSFMLIDGREVNTNDTYNDSRMIQPQIASWSVSRPVGLLFNVNRGKDSDD